MSPAPDKSASGRPRRAHGERKGSPRESQVSPAGTAHAGEERDQPRANVAAVPGPEHRSRASATRRADIIAAAIQVIARDGLRACTVSALEHETGFARGHFTYHFHSKEEIIGLAFATVGSDWASNQMAVPPGETAAGRLESRVRTAVAWAKRRPDYYRCLMAFRVEMMRDPDAFPLAPRIRAQIQELGAQMIREGIAEGSFAVADPVSEARILFATVDGMLMHAAIDPTFFPNGDALADRAWQVVSDRLTRFRDGS